MTHGFICIELRGYFINKQLAYWKHGLIRTRHFVFTSPSYKEIFISYNSNMLTFSLEKFMKCTFLNVFKLAQQSLFYVFNNRVMLFLHVLYNFCKEGKITCGNTWRKQSVRNHYDISFPKILNKQWYASCCIIVMQFQSIILP